MQIPHNELIERTTSIVAAYVSNNPVPMSSLPDLIASVDGALRDVGKPAAETPKQEPAVPIKKSVTDDAIICLENGRRFKSLARHLGTLGMTPDEYRRKWGLPAEAPPPQLALFA